MVCDEKAMSEAKKSNLNLEARENRSIPIISIASHVLFMHFRDEIYFPISLSASSKSNFILRMSFDEFSTEHKVRLNKQIKK
jgi:hypothetical protein